MFGSVPLQQRFLLFPDESPPVMTLSFRHFPVNHRKDALCQKQLPSPKTPQGLPDLLQAATSD